MIILIFDIIWLILLCFFLAKFVIDIHLGNKTKRWHETKGTILRCDVISSGGFHSFYPRVEYTYSVGHRTFHSTQVAIDTFNLGGSAKHIRWVAQHILHHYHRGDQMTVHYDPQMPQRAVLHPGVPFKTYVVSGVIVLFILFQLYVIHYRFF